MNQVELFIVEQSDNQQVILQFLHDLLTAEPGVQAKLRWKIPFYFRKSWICYLNPIKKTNGIELAFTRGNELSNGQGLLSHNGRKQISGVIFNDVADIPVETVLEVFQEALLLDETVPYASKRTKIST
ncbi:MAG: DUF1801 domain-containing protein [Bacteroidota bacterium]